MKDDSLEVLLERMRKQIDNNVSGEEYQEEMHRTVSEVWAHFRRMQEEERSRWGGGGGGGLPVSGGKTPTLGDLGCADWGNAAVPGGAGVPFDEQDPNKHWEELRRIVDKEYAPLLKKLHEKYKLTKVE
jgi:hypothetical protein